MVKLEDDKYRKAHVPKHPKGGKKLEVLVWFEVIDIVEVNEPDVRNFKSSA